MKLRIIFIIMYKGNKDPNTILGVTFMYRINAKKQNIGSSSPDEILLKCNFVLFKIEDNGNILSQEWHVYQKIQIEDHFTFRVIGC